MGSKEDRGDRVVMGRLRGVCGHGVVAMDGGECGDVIGKFGWERNLGVENRRRRDDLRTAPPKPASWCRCLAVARFAPPRGWCAVRRGDGSVDDLQRSAHAGHRTPNVSMEKCEDCSLPPERALCKPPNIRGGQRWR